MSDEKVRLISGPAGSRNIDELELFYARRALTLLKARLGREGLLDLLASDVEEGNAFLREHARASGGRFQQGTTVLSASGLTAGEFVAWMQEAFSDEKVLIDAHPEHYVLGDEPDGSVHVVENVGYPVCSFSMASWDAEATAWADEAEALLPASDFPHKKATNLVLADGTVVGRVLIQFGDDESGFTSSLTVYLPATCAADVLDHHLRHFAVEFRNWIVAATR